MRAFVKMGPRQAPWSPSGLCCVLVCLLFAVFETDAHVALTFPPARKYDLDFLDSSRTKPPCGMPRGEWKEFLNGSMEISKTVSPEMLYVQLCRFILRETF